MSWALFRIRSQTGNRWLFASAILLGCIAHAEPDIGEKYFVYDQPVLDVIKATAEREELIGGRSDVAIRVRYSDATPPHFIFFSVGGKCHVGNVWPAIAVFRDGEWNTVSFKDADFNQHIWLNVYLSYHDVNRMYAISEAHCESGSPELFVYRSDDGGRTWRVSVIEKYYMAEFVSLRIDSDGAGEIVVQTLNDADPIGGHYIHRTNDWGATWAQPEFRKTVLRPPMHQRYYSTDYVPIHELMKGISDRYSKLD